MQPFSWKDYVRALRLPSAYVPHFPHPTQGYFLLLDDLEALYGGAAGGGKTDALLMAALQYVDVPGYTALLMRRTYRDLALPGSIMDRAHTWLRNKPGVRWDAQEHTYTWEGTGARLTFGYMESESDKYRYGSMEAQFVGIDEVSQFRESMYAFMASRLRRLQGSAVPLRLRCGSNPVGIGARWLYERFIQGGDSASRRFVPATLEDNPSLDQQSYIASLKLLDPVTYKRLRYGDWLVRESGGLFQEPHLQRCTLLDIPTEGDTVRYWDLASTPATDRNRDPDWTVGLKMRHHEGRYWIMDVKRARLDPFGVESLLRATAEADGYEVAQHIEQEGGSSGSIAIDHYQRYILNGFEVYGHRQTGDKITRARPFSAAVAAGNVFLLHGAWNEDFIDELVAFPQPGVHDDQVDAASGAHHELANVVHGG